MQSEENNNNNLTSKSEQSMICQGCYSYYAAAASNFMCSKCHKDAQLYSSKNK